MLFTLWQSTSDNHWVAGLVKRGAGLIKVQEKKHLRLYPESNFNRPALQPLAYALYLPTHRCLAAIHLSKEGNEKFILNSVSRFSIYDVTNHFNALILL